MAADAKTNKKNTGRSMFSGLAERLSGAGPRRDRYLEGLEEYAVGKRKKKPKPGSPAAKKAKKKKY